MHFSEHTDVNEIRHENLLLSINGIGGRSRKKDITSFEEFFIDVELDEVELSGALMTPLKRVSGSRLTMPYTNFISLDLPV